MTWTSTKERCATCPMLSGVDPLLRSRHEHDHNKWDRLITRVGIESFNDAFLYGGNLYKGQCQARVGNTHNACRRRATQRLVYSVPDKHRPPANVWVMRRGRGDAFKFACDDCLEAVKADAPGEGAVLLTIRPFVPCRLCGGIGEAPEMRTVWLDPCEAFPNGGSLTTIDCVACDGDAGD